MGAEMCYPEGIGKHIVCIYDGHRPPRSKQLVGANPEPPLNSRMICGKCEECKEQYKNQDGGNAFS